MITFLHSGYNLPLNAPPDGRSTDGNNAPNSSPVWDCNITPLWGSRSDASHIVYNNYIFGSAGGTRLISNANMAAVAQAGKKPKVNNPY
jgi:hypothetical protein